MSRGSGREPRAAPAPPHAEGASAAEPGGDRQATVRHDLRSGISALTGVLDLLERSRARLDADTVDDLLKRAHASARRLAALLDQLEPAPSGGVDPDGPPA